LSKSPKVITRAMAEKTKFTIHAALIRSQIMNQGGSIDKAILEAVMNSIDAGATDIVVTLDESTFSVRDNGKGLGTKSQIREYFRVFGAPHADGDAMFGR